MPTKRLIVPKSQAHLRDLMALTPIVFIGIGSPPESIFKIPTAHIVSFEYEIGKVGTQSATLKIHDVTYKLLDILFLNLFQATQNGWPLGISYGYDDPSLVSSKGTSGFGTAEINGKNIFDNSKFTSPFFLTTLLDYSYNITPSGVEIEMQLVPDAFNTKYLSETVVGTLRSLFSFSDSGEPFEGKDNKWNAAMKEAYIGAKGTGQADFDFQDFETIKDMQAAVLTKQFSKSGVSADPKDIGSALSDIQSKIRIAREDFIKNGGKTTINIPGHANPTRVVTTGNSFNKAINDLAISLFEEQTGIKPPPGINFEQVYLGTKGLTNPTKVENSAVTSQLSNLPIVNITKIVDFALARIEEPNTFYIPLYPNGVDFLYDYQSFPMQGRTVNQIINDISSKMVSVPLSKSYLDFLFPDRDVSKELHVEAGNRMVGADISFFSVSAKDALKFIGGNPEQNIISAKISALASRGDNGVVRYILFQFDQEGITYTLGDNGPIAHFTNYPRTNPGSNALSNPARILNTEAWRSDFKQKKNLTDSKHVLYNANEGFFQIREIQIDMMGKTITGSAIGQEFKKMFDTSRARPGIGSPGAAEPRVSAIIKSDQSISVQIGTQTVVIKLVSNDAAGRRKAGELQLEGIPFIFEKQATDERIKEKAFAELNIQKEKVQTGVGLTIEEKKQQEAIELARKNSDIDTVFERIQKAIEAVELQIQRKRPNENVANLKVIRDNLSKQGTALKKSDPKKVNLANITKNLLKSVKSNKSATDAFNTKIGSDIESNVASRPAVVIPFSGLAAGNSLEIDQQAEELLHELRAQLQIGLPLNMTLTTIGDPSWDWNDLDQLITVNIQDATGEPTFISGDYVITGIVQSLSLGDFKTVLTLVKDSPPPEDPQLTKTQTTVRDLTNNDTDKQLPTNKVIGA